jgi:hypothetical protein
MGRGDHRGPEHVFGNVAACCCAGALCGAENRTRQYSLAQAGSRQRMPSLKMITEYRTSVEFTPLKVIYLGKIRKP